MFGRVHCPTVRRSRRFQRRNGTALEVLSCLLLLTSACAGAVPRLSISDVTVSEINCTSQVATFTVSVSAPFGKNASVQFATADGSAVAGTDYTAVTGTLSFPRGSKASQTITVPITDVLIPGVNKTFYVKLSNPVNATLSKSQGAGTIQAPLIAKCQSCGLSCDDGDVCTLDSCSATLGCRHVTAARPPRRIVSCQERMVLPIRILLPATLRTNGLTAMATVYRMRKRLRVIST